MPRELSTHGAWDGSVINDLFGVPSKTTKTLCDRRVATTQINEDAPTCPACQAAKAELQAMMDRVRTMPPSSMKVIITVLSYEQWWQEVNKVVNELTSLDADELTDHDSRQAFEDGKSPQEYAEWLLQQDGFDFND